MTGRMTPKLVLADHIVGLHRQRPPLRLTWPELARWHARQHQQYTVTTHYHEFDNAGPLAGPNTTVRRPSGWYTGEGAVLTGPRGLAGREAL